MARKVGRPNEKTDSRDKLISHARELFTVMPYEKVSTRKIAERAGVNIAMIRYYFGNKEGLFETMIRETMAQSPNFPKQLVQIMNMAPSEMQRKLLNKVFKDISKPMENLISKKMHSENLIREDINPKFCRISFMSLMIFPFLAPASLHAIHGIELNETFLNQLLEHNIRVLSHGFLKTGATRSSGDNNEN